jgi:putative transposase
VREIQAFLAEMYAVEVSPDCISTVTDAVHTEVTDVAGPAARADVSMFFDVLRVTIREEVTVRSKAVYLALAILPDGSRDLLQACIVHLLRHSLDFANWKERKPLAAALRPLSGPTSFRSSPFRPPSVGVIYTTKALESVHARLREILKTRGHFPIDEAATKLIWLALRNITALVESRRLLAPHNARFPTAPTRIVVNAPHTKIRTLPSERSSKTWSALRSSVSSVSL